MPSVFQGTVDQIENNKYKVSTDEQIQELLDQGVSLEQMYPSVEYMDNVIGDLPKGESFISQSSLSITPNLVSGLYSLDPEEGADYCAIKIKPNSSASEESIGVGKGLFRVIHSLGQSNLSGILLVVPYNSWKKTSSIDFCSDVIYYKWVVNNAQTLAYEATYYTVSQTPDQHYISTSANAQSGKAVAEAVEPKADKKGVYDELVSGGAKNLISNIKVNDKTPYNFRTSGGSLDIGNREDNTIVGGTVVFNQLADKSKFSNGTTYNGLTRMPDTINGIITISGSNTAGNTWRGIQPFANTAVDLIITGHKYAVFGIDSLNTVTDNLLKLYLNFGTRVWQINKDGIYEAVGANSVPIANFRFEVGADFSVPSDNPIVIRPQIFDLTQMFGSTIADYIYSLETNSAGAGYTYFKNIFPLDYYSYNTGELLSVKTSAHRMIGFNAYNKLTDSAKVVGGYQYQITGTYDSTSIPAEFNLDTTTGYFTTTYPTTLENIADNTDGSDICIHLVWDKTRDNEYEEYVEHNYSLDSDLELRGLYKLDVNSNLYCDGDVYNSDGSVIRKYGKVSLSSLTWTSESYLDKPRIRSGTIEDLKVPSTEDYSSFILCNKYTPSDVPINFNNVDKTIAVYNQKVYIHDESISASATSSEIQTALSGVYLIYELATPTTESANPFTNPQYVDNWGTEEYIPVSGESIQLPVGHMTQYPIDLKSKLEVAPDSPSETGEYILTHDSSNGKNEYKKIDGWDKEYYPEMSTGLSNNLMSNIKEDDVTPYTFRTSGGNLNIGNREIDEIVGGTIAWNQLIRTVTGTSFSRNGIVCTYVSDDEITIRGEAPSYNDDEYATKADLPVDGSSLGNVFVKVLSDESSGGATNYYWWDSSDNVWKRNGTNTETVIYSFANPIATALKDHVYLCWWGNNVTTSSSTFCISDFNQLRGYGTNGFIWKRTLSGNFAYQAVIYEGASVNITITPQIFDLTKMFGPTIANSLGDYSYTSDPVKLGWFKKLFPNRYYTPNAGTLMSVKTSAHKMTGFNAYNHSTVTAKLVAGKPYQITGTYTDLLVNDESILSDLDENGYYTSEFETVLTVTGGNDTDTCVHLVWDGERDGEYEPYNEVTYPLQSDVEISDEPIVLSSSKYTTLRHPIVQGSISIYDNNQNLKTEGTDYTVNYITGVVTSLNGELNNNCTINYTYQFELNGIMLLDDDKSVYYDGDIYKSDGAVTRKYSTVDLSTINYILYNSSSFGLYLGSGITGMKNDNDPDSPRTSICSRYICSPPGNYGSFVNQNNPTLITQTSALSSGIALFDTQNIFTSSSMKLLFNRYQSVPQFYEWTTTNKELRKSYFKPNFIDTVATYNALTQYDTSGLSDDDVVRVTVDSTKGSITTYYSWDTTNNKWVYQDAYTFTDYYVPFSLVLVEPEDWSDNWASYYYIDSSEYLSGVYLTYEISTPTTENVSSYTNPQWVDDWGTEEYVDTRDVKIPVGHNTKYDVNLKAKIETLPDAPDNSGEYVIDQSDANGTTYKSLANSNAMAELRNYITVRVPAPPTTDGIYKLNCTVSDGSATYSWES